MWTCFHHRMGYLPELLRQHGLAPLQKGQPEETKCLVFWICSTNRLTHHLRTQLARGLLERRIARRKHSKTSHQPYETDRLMMKRVRPVVQVARHLLKSSNTVKFEADSLRASRMAAALVREQVPALVAMRCSVTLLHRNASSSSAMSQRLQPQMHHNQMMPTAVEIQSRPDQTRFSRSKQW